MRLPVRGGRQSMPYEAAVKTSFELKISTEISPGLKPQDSN
jgi:hypothetical protein